MIDPDPLTRLAEAIVDDPHVDLSTAEGSATNDADRRVIHNLRVLARLAAAHDAAPASQPEVRADEPVPTRWKHLRILELIGEGTFGRVFRAWDETLHREVALKLLRESVSEAHPRVIEEGRLLAKIRDPNVVTVYGADRADGHIGIWMECIQGRTLADLLREDGPCNAAEAAAIGQDICRALSAVHNAGLLHRDVKPRNVMREYGGRIVLLDFGSSYDVDDRRAVSRMAGTPLFIPPEVLSGNGWSTRADVYNVGVLLFHLVTGAYPFSGANLSEIRSAHSRGDRHLLRDLRPDLPEAFISTIDRAIAPDPAARYKTPGALRRALADVLADAVHRPTRMAWWPLAAASLLAATAATVFLMTRTAKTAAEQVHFTVDPPAGTEFADCCDMLRLSPDGERLAFVANNMVWIRAMNSATPKMVEGTVGAGHPFWSPDGHWLGFIQGGKVKKTTADGGPPPVSVIDGAHAGGTWNGAGVLLFMGPQEQLYQVRDTGGPSAPATVLDEARGDTAHLWPRFLPDERHFVFLAQTGQASSTGVYVSSLSGEAPRRILDVQSSVDYALGRLFYQRDGTLTTQRFDLRTLRVSGPETPLIDGIDYNPSHGQAAFSVADNGTLAYRLVAAPVRSLMWFTRRGQPAGTAGEPDTYSQLRLSPDGRHLALSRWNDKASADLFSLDLSTSVMSPLTSVPTLDVAWSPDGKHLAFETPQHGPLNLFTVDATGGNAVPLLETPERKFVDDWSSDGQLVVYHAENSGHTAIYAAPTAGDRQPRLLATAQPQGDIDQIKISPDGRWVSFESNESGRWEVYVAAFPAFDQRRQLSPHGGFEPHWRADGNEIFYRTPDRVLMAVAVHDTRKSAIEFGTPEPLFKVPDEAQWAEGLDNYAVSRDGSRVMLMLDTRRRASARINVITNWAAAALKQ